MLTLLMRWWQPVRVCVRARVFATACMCVRVCIRALACVRACVRACVSSAPVMDLSSDSK